MTSTLQAAKPRRMARAHHDELAAFRAATESTDPAIAAPAAQRLLDRIMQLPARRETMLWAEGPRVASIARLPGADPDVAGRTAAELSFVLAVECVRTALRCELPPTAEEIASIADLADAAHTACPDVLITRRALAMTRLLQGLPDQARTLLISVSRAGERPLTIATADAVRAVAEAEAGDPMQARRLLAFSEHQVPDHPLVALARIRLARRLA